MLYIFDLDGTLISSYMDNPDRDYHNWRVLPRRRERLAELRAAGHHVAVATNQAGVAFGYITEHAWKVKVGDLYHLLSLDVDEVRVCFAHPKGKPPYNDPEECTRRKPNPTMLFEFIEQFSTEQDDTIYVGDMDSDRTAARLAGVAYMDANDFFARSFA